MESVLNFRLESPSESKSGEIVTQWKGKKSALGAEIAIGYLKSSKQFFNNTKLIGKSVAFRGVNHWKYNLSKQHKQAEKRGFGRCRNPQIRLHFRLPINHRRKALQGLVKRTSSSIRNILGFTVHIPSYCLGFHLLLDTFYFPLNLGHTSVFCQFLERSRKQCNKIYLRISVCTEI